MLPYARIANFKNPGGGPAPLLHNPDPKRFKILSVVYLCLFLFSSIALVIPSLSDTKVKCMAKTTDSSFLTVTIFSSVLVGIYFLYMSKQKFGTEIEWSRVFLFMLCVVIGGGAMVVWGILIMIAKVREVGSNDMCSLAEPTIWLIGMYVSVNSSCLIYQVYLFLKIIYRVLDQLKSMSSFI